MPIRNLSERRRVPRIGKIHLGIKKEKPGGAEYPAATDYFVCPPDVHAVYGTEPKELRIMFVSNDPEIAASQYLRSYKRTVGLVCRGDGYRATARLDVDALAKANGEIGLGAWASAESKQTEMRVIPCAGEGYDDEPSCPAYKAGHCKRLMMLQFAVLGVKGLGVFQIDTSSVNSIQNVNGFIEYLSVLIGGRIAGIPLLLKLVPQEVSPDGRKKTVHVLKLDADFSMEELVQAGRKPTVELLPPPPDEEVPEDFFPEAVDVSAKTSEEATATVPAATPPEEPPPAANPRPALRGGTERTDITGPPASKAKGGAQDPNQRRFYAICKERGWDKDTATMAAVLGIPDEAHTLTKNWLEKGRSWDEAASRAAEVSNLVAGGMTVEQALAEARSAALGEEAQQAPLEENPQEAE